MSTQLTVVDLLEPRQLFAAATTTPPFPPASDFVSVIDNPFMPMPEGAKFLYKGVEGGEVTKDKVSVLSSYHKTILGVTATVVLDLVLKGSHAFERAHDFYAQDKNGNVWYLGEDTKEYDTAGKIISTEGSWLAGTNGAKAGIIMEANPKVGDQYFQEQLTGVAEDQAKVEATGLLVHAPKQNFTGALKTSEFTALEPDTAEVKYYVSGVGFVLSQTTKGDLETLKLLKFSGL
jgi:hypothetical protein